MQLSVSRCGRAFLQFLKIPTQSSLHTGATAPLQDVQPRDKDPTNTGCSGSIPTPKSGSLPHWELQLASQEEEQPHQITLRGQFPFLRPHRTTAPPRSLIGPAHNTNSPPLGHRSLLSSLKNLSSGSLFLTNPTNCASHTLINLSQPRPTPV